VSLLLANADLRKNFVDVLISMGGSVSDIVCYTFRQDKSVAQDSEESVYLKSTYTARGAPVNLSLRDVAYVDYRADDIADPEHVYNALTLIQTAFIKMMQGVPASPGSMGVAGISFIDGYPVLGEGPELTVSRIMQLITSRKYVNYGQENVRRISILLTAAAKDTVGTLPPEFFTAIHKLAALEKRQRRALPGQEAQDIRTA
jgi:hypothetical protein